MWGSYFTQTVPVAVQQKGFMGDLSDDQTQILNQMRDWVATENLDPLK